MVHICEWNERFTCYEHVYDLVYEGEFVLEVFGAEEFEGHCKHQWFESSKIDSSE